MTKFTNGIAEGKTLMLRRAPLFLRVVQAPDGKIDALDQLDDMPAVDEVVTVYKLVSNDGNVHLNMRDKRGRHCGGFFPMATYAVVEPQPEAKQVRSTKAWREWVEGQMGGQK